MCFRGTLLIVALVTLVHSDKLPEKKCGLAYVCVEPNCCEKHPPVIILHAVSHNKETWNDIYEKIPNFTRRRVCIYDARNHGESFRNYAFTINILGEDLKCFMDAMYIEKAALVGHGMGGLTAMQFALKYPSKVEMMCVEDIGPIFPREIMGNYDKELNLLADCEKAVPENADEATARKAIDCCIRQAAPNTDPQGVYKQHTPLIYRQCAWHWQTNFQALGTVLNQERRNTTLGKYQGRYCGKSLFIYSTASPFKVCEQKEHIKKFFPKANFVAVPGAEHFIHTTHRKDFSTAMTRFLNCQSVDNDSDVNND